MSKYKLLIYFLVLILLPISIIGFLTNIIFSDTLENTASESTIQMISQANENIDNRIKNIENMMDLIERHPQVLEFFRMKVTDDPEKRAIIESTVRSFLAGFSENWHDIEGIVLISKNDLFLSNELYKVMQDPLIDERWYKDSIDRNGRLKVRRGEILGIAGLMGAGRTEVMEAVFGARKIDNGEIIIKGRNIKLNSPHNAIKHGIALVTEDRKLLGLNLKSSVKDNMTLANLKDYCLLNQIVRVKDEQKIVDRQIKALRIKTPSRNKIVNSLSGGNQQKVIIAKWLLCNPDILILDEPTRGIDVGAKAEIHRIMSSLAAEGKAIIMISSEMPEILGMSDRVIVLHEGRITGEFSRDELDQEKIMLCATGHDKGEIIA